MKESDTPLIIIVAGGGAFAYTQGYGMPSQQDQVNALFADPQNADVYAASVDESKKARIADTVTQGGQVTINGTTNNLGTAEVYATATTSQGGEVPYQISGEQSVYLQPVLTLFDPGFAPFHIVSKNETFI